MDAGAAICYHRAMASKTRRSPRQHAASPSAGITSARPGCYWLYGIHPVAMALKNPARTHFRLLGTEAALEKLGHAQGTLTSPRVLDALLGTAVNHQGVALEVQPLPATALEAVLDTGKPLVMLDQVTDPQNIGAILRSAAAFGVAGVIVQDRHSPSESAVIAKVSAGGLELVPLVAVTNLSRAIETAQKRHYHCIGLAGEAPHSLAEQPKTPATLLVLGAEGSGLRRLVAEHCDSLAHLPMDKRMESLNVSHAAAIALYELAR